MGVSAPVSVDNGGGWLAGWLGGWVRGAWVDRWVGPLVDSLSQLPALDHARQAVDKSEAGQ